MLYILIKQLYDSGITSFAILIVNMIACYFTAVLFAKEKKRENRGRSKSFHRGRRL